MHVDRDVGFLALVVTADEGGLEGGLATRLHAAQGLVETLQHAVGAHLVGVAADRDVLELLAVDRGGEVDGQVVTVLHGAVCANKGGKALAQGADLLVDLLVGDGRVVDGHLDALVVLHLELRSNVDLGGENELVVVLQLGDLDIGLAEREDLLLLDRFVVELRDGVVDSFADHRAATDVAVDQPRRRLARAEALDPNLLRERLVGHVESVLELLEGHLDGQLDPGRAELLDIGLHGAVLLGLPAGVRVGPQAHHTIGECTRAPRPVMTMFHGVPCDGLGLTVSC